VSYLAVKAVEQSRTGWDWKPLRRVAHLRREANSDSSSRLLALSSDRGVEYRPDDGGRQLPSDQTITGYWRVRPGDLVFNPMWAIGGGVAVSTLSGAVSTAYRIYEPSPSLSPRFLHYWLRSEPAIEQYRLLIRGITTFDRSITREDLDGMPVPVPRLAVQRAISNYLDTETARIDALIGKKQQMVELLEERWTAFRSEEILRGYDPVAGAGSVPAWETRTLGATVTLQRGHDLPSDSRNTGSVPVVSSGGISGWHDRAVCEPPGVVTGRYGTIGQTYYLDVPYWPLNTTLFVRDFRGNEPRWVYHMLATLPLSIDAEKSAVTGINRNVVGALKVPVPPVKSQRDIAAAIDGLRGESEEIERPLRRQVELLKEHREALITAAVTGELDITEAA
jgi:type I restriction enzyme, S subunit